MKTVRNSFTKIGNSLRATVMKKLLIFILFIFTSDVFSTDWMKDKAKDPVSGDSVDVYRISSYGGYIYQWPSKYDGIYWPYTDESFIYLNSNNGYIAFGSDFEKISPEQIVRVKRFLGRNYNSDIPLSTHMEKLKWLFRVYEARGTDNDFLSLYFRLMAYMIRENKDESNDYRRKAVIIMEEQIKETQPSSKLAQLYCVLGFYYKLLGMEENSSKYLKMLKELTWYDKNGKEDKNNHEYFQVLMTEIINNEYITDYYRKKRAE